MSQRPLLISTSGSTSLLHFLLNLSTSSRYACIGLVGSCVVFVSLTLPWSDHLMFLNHYKQITKQSIKQVRKTCRSIKVHSARHLRGPDAYFSLSLLNLHCSQNPSKRTFNVSCDLKSCLSLTFCTYHYQLTHCLLTLLFCYVFDSFSF